MHVVVCVRRPPLRRPQRPTGSAPSFGIGPWVLRPPTVFDNDSREIRTPLRRRIMFSGAFFRVGRRWEWYLPSVLTVWHRDPETDGTDSSCRNAARSRRQAAIKSHRYIAAAWWDFWLRHYDLFHWHHWTLQFDLAQGLRRWALTRCETCGGRQRRGRPVNFHVVVDRDAEKRRSDMSFRQRWLTGERNLHHYDCSDVASVRVYRANLPSWLRFYGRDEWAMNHQREREPYYGCFAWWRELILGEPPDVAAALAAAHVQRSIHPCSACDGRSAALVADVDAQNERRRAMGMELVPVPHCETCDDTGHERVEHPVPAELV